MLKLVYWQGGAMSLLQLRTDVNLAGIACLSGYLPLSYKPGVVSSTNKGTPVRMWHGTADPVVSLTALCPQTYCPMQLQPVEVTLMAQACVLRVGILGIASHRSPCAWPPCCTSSMQHLIGIPLLLAMMAHDTRDSIFCQLLGYPGGRQRS